MKAHIFLSFLSLAVLTAHLSLADDLESKTSARAEKTAKGMRAQIVSELKKLQNHPWAGEYYAGDGLGVNTTLSIAPKSGFVFEWHGCLGLYDRNYGAVVWTNDHLRLSFTFENKQKGFQGLAPELIPVRWGDRRYLIPADDVAGFCNRVNDASEPRDDVHGLFLLRKGDEKKPVSGSPTVPKAFERYLLSKPIAAEIISVGAYTTRPSAVEWNFKDTLVILNAGTVKGLRPGMELLVTEPANVVESVRIVKVEENQSEAIMTQAGEDEPGPKVGWHVSTRAPWRNLTGKSK